MRQSGEKKMVVRVCPIRGLYRILTEETPSRWGAVISSASEIAEEKLWGIPFVFRQYEDLDWACRGRSFSREDAAAVADFLRSMCGGLDRLYCCCDAGQSRSPAVAAAVMRWMGQDDMPVWCDPQYHPNMLVFSMLSEALGMPVTDEEVDLRIYTSREAFRNAIKR